MVKYVQSYIHYERENLHHSETLLNLTSTCSIHQFISRYTDTLKWTNGVHTDSVGWANISLIGYCLQTLINICVQLRQVAMKVKSMSSLDDHANPPPQLAMSLRSIYPSPHEHSKDPKVFVQVWLQGLAGTHSSLSNNRTTWMNVVYTVCGNFRAIIFFVLLFRLKIFHGLGHPSKFF